MPKLKGILFDLDGTLSLTQKYHYQAYAAIFQKYGLHYTTEDDITKYAGAGSALTFELFFKANGQTITPAQAEQYVQEKNALYDQILAAAKIEPTPGIIEFLKKMHAEKIIMAVATGNRLEPTNNILKRIGIAEYFQAILSSKDKSIKNPKPAPDIFLAAAAKIQLTPNECVVFEDAVNGIKAGKAGGFITIGITTGTSADTLKSAGADFVISTYDEVTPTMLTL